MWGKVALNVFYNIAIFLSFYAIYIGFTTGYYAYVLAGAFSATVFIILKLKLIKQVKEKTKQP
jgi:hypothetical protein